LEEGPFVVPPPVSFLKREKGGCDLLTHDTVSEFKGRHLTRVELLPIMWLSFP